MLVPAHLHALCQVRVRCPILQAAGKAPVELPALVREELSWAALLKHSVSDEEY